ncbi:MAG: HNH endonuclease [Gallionella sp.]|jgi:hypothetical protein
MRYPTLADRIIANSVQSDTHAYNGTPCWEWVRRCNNSGYPTMTRRLQRGSRKGQVVTVYAHRESVKAFTDRRVTPKMVIMHLCNNRSCVNPAHLQGGTQKQNIRQCVAEGRHKSPFHK